MPYMKHLKESETQSGIGILENGILGLGNIAKREKHLERLSHGMQSESLQLELRKKLK